MVNTGPLAPAHPSGLPVPPELTDEDCAWVRRHLEIAGWEPPAPGRPPADTSWLTMERIRG